MVGALPAEWLSAFGRVVSPVSPVPVTGEALWIVGALLVASVIAFAFMVRGVGLHPAVTAGFCLLALGVTTHSAVVAQPAPNASLAVNYAGFLLPVALSVALLVSGRAPAGRTLLAVAVCTLVAHLCSEAIPHEGVLLYYRWPAIIAGSLGAVLAWGAWEKAGPIAFVAGANGVIIGADLFRLDELITPSGTHRIILGGAGVMDGIFIVGLLGVLVASFWRAIAEHVQRTRELFTEDDTPEPDTATGTRSFGPSGE